MDSCAHLEVCLAAAAAVGAAQDWANWLVQYVRLLCKQVRPLLRSVQALFSVSIPPAVHAGVAVACACRSRVARADGCLLAERARPCGCACTYPSLQRSVLQHKHDCPQNKSVCYNRDKGGCHDTGVAAAATHTAAQTGAVSNAGA